MKSSGAGFMIVFSGITETFTEVIPTFKELGKKKGMKQILGEEKVAGYVFSLPFIIGFLLFLLIPMVLSLYYSFCKYDIQNAPQFVGFRNYVNIFQDDIFWKALM